MTALSAADAVLILLQCETLSQRGVDQLLDTVHVVRRLTSPGLDVLGVLPTLFDGRTKHPRVVVDTIASTCDVKVMEPAIARSIRSAEAPDAGRSVM